MPNQSSPLFHVIKLRRKATRDQTNNLAVGLEDTQRGQYVEFPFDTNEEKLGVLTPLHGDVLGVFLKVVPLGIISWLVPAHDGFPCSLYRTGCVHPLLNRLPLNGFRQKLPGLLALLHILRPMSINRSIALRHTPRTSCNPCGVACGLNRIDQTRAVKKSCNLLDHTCNVCPSMNFGTRMPFCDCLLYTSPSPRDQRGSRMPSSA